MSHAMGVPGLPCPRQAAGDNGLLTEQIGGRARRRAAVTAVALAFSCLLPACSSSSLYFHNQAYEDSTKEAKADVGKLDVTAAFTSLSTQSESLARDEDQAAIAALVALRNRVLVGLIDPSDGDWLSPLTPTQHFGKNAPAAHLEKLIEDDLRKLKVGDAEASEAEYLTGAQRLMRMQATAEAAAIKTKALRDYAAHEAARLKIDPAPGLDCSSATQIGTQNARPDLPQDVIGAYRVLAASCGQTDDRDQFLAKFVEPDPNVEGAISRAARYYREALQTQKASKAEAESLKEEVASLLNKMGKPQAQVDALSEQLEQLIKKIGEAGALARFVSFKEIDTYLECGLIKNLSAAKGELSPSEKAPKADDNCDTEFLEKEGNAALAGLIKAIMGRVKDKVSTERLALINANIMSLADMRQRISAAEATVAYLDKKLVLYRAQIVAVLDQYRLLRQTQGALFQLQDEPAKGFADLRGGADRRNMAEALSGYVSSWNYGRIPADLIDFRFLQAQRAHDIQLANLTAANHKALVAPIADALAAYGAGGITPDTLAEVISNLGILSGIILN